MSTIAIYSQKGESMDYTNATTSTIKAGEALLVGHRIGIAGGDINPGEVGSLIVKGVFKIPKMNDSTACAQGEPVYWDTDTAKVTSVAGELICVGSSFAPAAADAEYIEVAINEK